MADYGRVAALDLTLVNEAVDRGRIGALDLTLINEAVARGRIGALDLTLVNEAVPRGRIGALDLTLVNEAVPRGRIGALDLVLVTEATPVTAVVPNITGFVLIPATFNAGGSTGLVGATRWSWVSVPGGSAIANVSPTPMPNSGGTTFVAMTSNAALYHCEGSGTDSSGNGNTATFTSVTTGAAGKVGSFAWSFDTTSAYATMTSTVSFAGDFTFAFWFFDLEPTGQYRSAMNASAGTFIPVLVDITTNQLGLWNGSAQLSNFTMLSANYTGWHHMAVVGTSSGQTYFVDGRKVGFVPVKLTQAMQYIGNQNGFTQRFAKRMDEIAIWTRALSFDEISAIYANQASGFAGSGTTFQFTPDVVGTYTIQASVFGSLTATQSSVNANALISTAPPIQGAWPQEQLGIQFGVQGQRLKRHRGQM